MSSDYEVVAGRGSRCSSCGQPLDASMAFCPRCGTLAPRDDASGQQPVVGVRNAQALGGATPGSTPSFPPTNTQLPYPYAQPLQRPGSAAEGFGTPVPGTWTANQPTAYASGAGAAGAT